MTNHLHLLIERREDDIGRIMQRVLTAYTQYYNRRYKKVGHVLQGRYKSVLCQSDKYLTTLVRYIHLNPVNAKMVANASEYPSSSHRAYLGLDPAGPLDVVRTGTVRFLPLRIGDRRSIVKHHKIVIPLSPLWIL